MKDVKFAVFTDLHYDAIHDGRERLETFVQEVRLSDVDFIIDLGDFCVPKKENAFLMELLDTTGKPHYHVVGNHGTDDRAYEDLLKFLRLEKNYHSFQIDGIKFIVLDCCYIQTEDGYISCENKNYKSQRADYPVIPDFELSWLEEELADDSRYYVILSHHSLENEFPGRGVKNRMAVRERINQANASGKRVLLCLNGHDHGDSLRKLGETLYFGMNSMSYLWFGPEFEHFCYSDEIHKNYPHLKDMVLYKEPLYASVRITEQGQVEINGMNGHYQAITPKELGLGEMWNGRLISPNVSSRMIIDRDSLSHA